MNRIHQNTRASFKFIVLFTFNYFDLLRWIIVCLVSGQSSVIYGETLSNLLSLFVPISRSNNTVEPNVSWDERSTSEKRPASGGEEEDCQRFSSQFTGELTMGLYYARCKCGGLLQLPACLPLVIDRKVNTDRNRWISKFTFVFCFLFSKQVTDADAHLDVQRTVDGERTTSSACLRYSDLDKNYCLGLCLFIIILINVRDKAR